MRQTIHLSENISKFPSTILIPIALQKSFKKQILKRNGIRNYFHSMVKARHWVLFALKARENTGKTLFQPKGMELVRYDFRPFEGDWESFRLLAQNQRVSMTRLFTLMVLYWDGINKAGGVPTTTLTLLQHIHPASLKITTKRLILYHHTLKSTKVPLWIFSRS